MGAYHGGPQEYALSTTMRQVGAFSGIAFGSLASKPSCAYSIQPRSMRSARGKSRWSAGSFITTAPLGRIRVPSKNEARPSLSQLRALVARDTYWCAASWKSVPTMPAKPLSGM